MSSDKTRQAARSGRRLTIAIATVLAGSQASEALAQSALDEVIVTARKREENLQDIPESIQALPAKMLARAGLQELEDYARFLPSLSYTAQAPGANKLIFRGVADSSRSFYSDTSAAIYLDEQPLTQPTQTPEPRLVDIERVEALSGPQGTLYGGSAQSGTLRIVTNKPDLSKFEVIADATVKQGGSSDVSHDISGVLNVPLIPEQLAIRFVGFSAKDGGFIDNVLGDRPGSQDGNFDNAAVAGENASGEGNYVGGRATMRWLPNEAWSVTAGVVFQDFDGSGNQDNEPGVVGSLRNVRFLDEKREDRWTQFGLTLEGDLGFADLVSATTYFTREIFYSLDNTAYLSALQALYVSDPVTYAQYALGPDPIGTGWEQNQDTRRFSQEFRLSHEGTKWAWLAGLFYERFDDHWDYRSQMEDFESTNAFLNYWSQDPFFAVPGTSENAFYRINNHTKTEQYAAFGEVTYNLDDQWSFIVGGRWFSTERDRRFKIFQPANTLLQDENPIETTKDFSKKASVRYRFDDRRMAYLLYSEGFRNGGANIVRPGAVLPRVFDPDKLKNFELGFKSRWLDDRLQVNLSLFHMVWNDFQTELSDPGPNYAIMVVNAGDAEINGTELELSFVPIDGIDLGFSASFLDAKLTQDLVVPPDTVLVADGARLPISPEMKFSAYAQYISARELFGGHAFARLQYSYNGDALRDLGCDSQDCTMRSYAIADAKIGIEGPDGEWEINLFVDNLTDKHAELFKFDVPVGAITVNRPREYGIRFMKRWGRND